MLGRAILVWLCIIPAAIVNGAVRDLVLAPMLGDTIARAVSSVALAGAVLLITRLSVRWIGPVTTADTWLVGLVWLALTLAFELLVGHYVLGTPWQTLRADYDVLAGRLWILVPAATLVAPRLMCLREIP